MAVLKTRQGQHSQFIFVVFACYPYPWLLLCFASPIILGAFVKSGRKKSGICMSGWWKKKLSHGMRTHFVAYSLSAWAFFVLRRVLSLYPPHGISNCSCWHLVHEGEDEKESSLFGHGLSFKWCLYHRICISCTACMSWHQAMFPFFVRFMNHWNVTRTIIHCAEGYLTSICTYRQASPISFVWVEQKVVVVDFISHGVCFFSKAICTWKYSPKTNMTMEKHRKNNNSKMYFLLNWWFSSQPY